MTTKQARVNGGGGSSFCSLLRGYPSVIFSLSRVLLSHIFFHKKGERKTGINTEEDPGTPREASCLPEASLVPQNALFNDICFFKNVILHHLLLKSLPLCPIVTGKTTSLVFLSFLRLCVWVFLGHGRFKSSMHRTDPLSMAALRLRSDLFHLHYAA